MTTRVANYYRISADALGLGLGVERQREDCNERADREGWIVVAEFSDNDISASTNSRKPRPDYQEMLARTRAGEFDVILSYSNSRLTRRPLELEDLITLHAETGVLIKTIVSGDDDLSTADGRMVARIKADVDAAEAERTSERAKRAKAAKRARGEYVGGARRFGFGFPMIVKTSEGREILSARDRNEVNPEEAELIRSGAKAILAGDSVASVVRAWNESGIQSVRKAGWMRQQVRNALLDPGIAPAILDQDTYDTLRALLTENARTHTRGSEPVYPLVGIAECSICGSKFQYYRRTGFGRGYRCPKLHNGIQSVNIEPIVLKAVISWYASMKTDPNRTKQLRTITQVQKERAVILDERTELEDQLEKKLLSPKGARSLLEDVASRLKRLDDELTVIRQEDAHEALTEAAETAMLEGMTDDIASGWAFQEIMKRFTSMTIKRQKTILSEFRVIVYPAKEAGGYGDKRTRVFRGDLELTGPGNLVERLQLDYQGVIVSPELALYGSFAHKDDPFYTG